MTKIEATVVEIGEENVKYTFGRYGVYGHPARNNTIKKKEIIAILYEDGSIYAIESIDEKLILEKIEEIDKKIEMKEKKRNILSKKTTASILNYIPGLGSLVIMNDMTGAVIQWGLLGCGISIIAYNRATCDEGLECLNLPFLLSLYLIPGSVVFGAIRPFTYNAASSQNSGFNMAILPNKQGYLKTYLFYNIAF